MALFRWKSGSVIVPSGSHDIWNTVAYALFGTGVEAGALGIQDTAIYGAEVGIVGLGLNVVFAVCYGCCLGVPRRGQSPTLSSSQRQPPPSSQRCLAALDNGDLFKRRRRARTVSLFRWLIPSEVSQRSGRGAAVRRTGREGRGRSLPLSRPATIDGDNRNVEETGVVCSYHPDTGAASPNRNRPTVNLDGF